MFLDNRILTKRNSIFLNILKQNNNLDLRLKCTAWSCPININDKIFKRTSRLDKLTISIAHDNREKAFTKVYHGKPFK